MKKIGNNNDIHMTMVMIMMRMWVTLMILSVDDVYDNIDTNVDINDEGRERRRKI